jgi:leader peptidase (prepilin peptidase) / N-methyltransferase
LVIHKFDEFWFGFSSYRALMHIADLARRHALNTVTVLLAGFAFWRLGLSAELPAVIAFVVGGVLLSVIDWKVQRLPTRLVYLTLAAVTVGLVFAAIVERDWRSLATAALGATLFANAFFLVWFLGRNVFGFMVIGLGDVRLAALLGLLLGWYGLPYVLYGAIAGNVLAVLFAAAMCLKDRRVHLRYSFGPPLIVGTLAVVLFHG